MNDLISRSALLEELNGFSLRIAGSANAMALVVMDETKKSIVEMIKEQPSAFDLKILINQINNIKTDNSCTDCEYRDRCDQLQEFYSPADNVDLCALTTKNLALEITKASMNEKQG